jgi:hypothetical protein
MAQIEESVARCLPQLDSAAGRNRPRRSRPKRAALKKIAAGGPHRDPKRRALSEQRDAGRAEDMIRSALKDS